MRLRIVAAAGLSALLLGVLLQPPPPPRPERFAEDWELDGARIAWVIPDLELQYFDGTTLWATRHLQVWTSDDEGLTWELRGSARSSGTGVWAAVRTTLGRTRIALALSPRRGVESLLVLDSGEVLLSAPPTIQRSTDGGRTFEPVHRHREARGILRHWDHAGDVVIFGEYGTRDEDHAVWRSEDRGVTWTNFWTLPPKGQEGGGRHLHGVQIAPDGRPWLMVGDLDEHARLGPLVEGRLEAAAAGDQRAKATALVFSGDAVIWGTDAPRGPWGVFRWDPSRGLQRLHELGGPVLWSSQLADGSLVVATEIEGKGVETAELWISPDGTRWHQLARAPAFEDGPIRWGTISFPLGEPLPALLGTVDRLGSLSRAAIRFDPVPEAAWR